MSVDDVVSRLRATIERSHRFVLSGHVNIDGDSLGSMLAMAYWLRGAGKDVRAFCFEPILDRYAFMAPDEMVTVFDPRIHAAEVARADCFMMFDFSATGRMPGLWDLVRGSRAVKVCIDHHPTDSPPGDLNVHRPEAAATGKVLLDLFRTWGVKLDRSIATALLVAIGTDTGWFRYRNTSPEVLRDVADLLACGVDASAVYREVYQHNSTALLRLIGRVVSEVRSEFDGRLLWATIPYSWIRELGVGSFETDELLDLLRTGNGAEIVALIRETETGAVRINLRSSGPVDVGRIAKDFGGGGHSYAAGATLTDLSVTTTRVLERLRREFPR